MTTVVFPVLDRAFLTRRCLQSLQRSLCTEVIRVVVVDNGSGDNTLDMIHSEFPSILNNPTQVCASHENLGFARGCNMGMEVALSLNPETDILITNNDIEFEVNTLQQLHDFAFSNPTYGIVGGKLFLPDGRIQHAGAFLNQFGWGQHIGGGDQDSPIYGTPKECEYVTGALFYIKNEVLKQVGFFDPQFSPAFWEETDYCYRARKYGYKVMYCPTARAVHNENATGKELFGENIHQISQLNQIKFWKKLDSGALSNSQTTHDIGVLLSGKVYGGWSFSEVFRNLAKGIQRNGVDVSIAPEEYHSTESMPDWEIQSMIRKPNDYWNRIVIRSCEGDHMYLMPPGRYRIALTTGEATHYHKGWVEQLNHVDEVWSMSSFHQRVLLDSGVTTPIYVIPAAVDTSIFNTTIWQIAQRPTGKFRFCSIFMFGQRKGVEILLKAYGDEFRGRTDVELVIHSPSMASVLRQRGVSVQDFITQHAGPGHATIFLSLQYVADQYIAKLLAESHCFVLPSRCEGFGLPFLEAAAVGTPSITTNYGGQLDFIDESTGLLVDYTLVDMPLQIVPYFRNYVGSQWAEPDIESLRHAMRWAVEHPDEMQQMGQVASERATHYSIESIGIMAIDRLRRSYSIFIPSLHNLEDSGIGSRIREQGKQ